MTCLKMIGDLIPWRGLSLPLFLPIPLQLQHTRSWKPPLLSSSHATNEMIRYLMFMIAMYTAT